MGRGVLLPAVLLLLSCYNPAIQAEQFLCAQDADCPGGFKCSSCYTCIPKSAPVDQCTSACTYGDGSRAAVDLRNPAVAFCPAAWSVPGVDDPPACNRQPVTDDGRDAAGTACALADNCAIGWHVCIEDDLIARGLTRDQCAGVEGFWVTQQRCIAVTNPFSPSTIIGGTCQDDVPDPRLVVGCGKVPVGGTFGACDVLTRTLGAANCETNWSCSAGINAFTYEALTKRGSAAGGVMCCRDLPE